jgi:hypothetical protein
MSAAVRAAIAAAANTVAGIDVEPYYTAVTKTGSGCVRLNRTEHPDIFGGMDYWDVIVRLPQDLAEAEKYMDTVRLPLYQALEKADPRVMWVDSATPQQVVFDFGAAPLPCLIIAGHRAQEE